MQLSRKAFTLVEIMIVVSIIALLATIAIPNLIRARVQANEAAAQGNLKLISNALENYAAINSVYPTTITALTGVTPPYLSTDYFTGVYGGYTFIQTFADYSYLITATPTSATAGTASFTMATGGVLTRN